MMKFTDYLAERLEAGGFTTEDALASFLPLLRQVANAHRAGLVGPLQGVNAIQVEANRLWFEESQTHTPVLETGKLREKEDVGTRAVEVVQQYRSETQIEHGVESVISLQIGRRGEPFPHPVYLLGYVGWEHELGHHDPLTDVFVLGLILGSMACGLDLNDPDDLTEFVKHRRNLFDLNAQLHPVLAKAIVRMTELNRRRRPQDLAALLHTLENHRDQDVDFEFALARMPKYASTDRPGRRSLILSCLQQRLFDLTKRNRLLHFRATTQTVNLTWASVPLSFDVRNIRPEQILTWGHQFRESVSVGSSIPLNKYLRFEEAVYLPGLLDQIRTEARRDQNEYGFAQLRLVIGFLRWANLKEKPPERLDSPLVLLPVRLTKTKGVRDVHTLEPIGTEAEINPVLRFQLKQLYAVDLPETVDLSKSSLDDLYAYLAGKVQASEPAVTIEKIDKPRINLIHAKAQRRLEQYRRRVRLSGRGVKSFLDIDYSYDRTNFHPLGMRLFQTRITALEPRLRSIVEESPRPRTHMSPPVDAPSAEKERQLYSQAEEETNPYRWEFDLCNVTLGNFHYRKMSLVRDYSELLDGTDDHPAFDAIFSLDPREAFGVAQVPLPLVERFPIVNCDSTQTSAIAHARSGKHLIIQGPPGTGKSQTITNLIADYAARGQRVLFVCEKRAAIDVVHHRLQQAGLRELCCLIHDAQEDKKEFIADLKATYEAFQTSTPANLEKTESDRTRLMESMSAECSPLERYHSAMRASPPQAGLPLHRLVQRVIELRDSTPELLARDRERLPQFSTWQDSRPDIVRVREHLDAIQPDGILANHPLHLLHERFGTLDRPLAAIQELLPRLRSLVEQIHAEFEPLGLPPESWDSLGKLRQLDEYTVRLSFLARNDMLALLKPKSELAKTLASFRKKVAAKELEIDRARTATTAWRNKLPPEETRTALDQAKRQERSLLRFLLPSWWRLRGIMNRSYDFTNRQVRTPFSQVLGALQIEHDRQAELDGIEADARESLSFDGCFREQSDQIAAISEGVTRLPSFLQSFHRHVLASDSGDEIVMAVANLHEAIAELASGVDHLLSGAGDCSLPELRDEFQRIEQSQDLLPGFTPFLRQLGALPPTVTIAWRRFPYEANRLEAAIARRTLDDLLAADPTTARFSAQVHARHVDRLEPLHDRWLALNATTVRDRTCRRFLENFRIASLPHAQLTAEQKEFKTRYNRGRRELEHEFGKTMRYRSIRDLVDDETGLVVRDLKPIWLMSPLSVSDALPLAGEFDVVIFDEASQVTLEEAVPAIFRAKQVLVVGDEMQLPPTSFFATRGSDDEEQILVEDASGRTVAYDLNSDSLLNHAARTLPSTMLGWHYRSRSESLISFSNAAFYQGRLLTVPEVSLPADSMTEILVHSSSAGETNTARVLDRPVSFHFLENGVYEQRRNTAEADYIARLVRGLITSAGHPSIGIIAFSEAQQNEIEQALNRHAREDDAFRERLEAEWEREDDGQFAGLLVKNLENIQGDERDVILLSVCYGHGPNGKMLMNFGPINQNGGERRLNVAFSRAREHMALITSFRHTAITNDYNDGARTLKNYIRYAESLSAGNAAAARRVLREMSPSADSRVTEQSQHIVIGQLADQLRKRGHHVDRDVGQSGFRCDLAVRAPDGSRYRLGILVDTEGHYDQDDLLARDLLRPRLLRMFDWKVARVLTKDWLNDSVAVVESVEQRLVETDAESQCR
jgi:hypothetical protein